MTPDTIVATLYERGARLEVLPGDRLAVTPGTALDDGLRQAIRAHKPALVQLLRAEPDYQRIYETLTATFGDAVDLRAFAVAYDAGARDLPERLAALEGTCEQLARDGAPESEYRQGVEALVNFVRQVREEHQRAQRAEAAPVPAPNGPLLVGVATPCLICGGTEYRPPRNGDGWWHCIACDPERPKPVRARMPR